MEQTNKVGRPKGSKNKIGMIVGRPKGQSKPVREIKKNSFSVKISDLELDQVEKLRKNDKFKGLNNRAFFMELIKFVHINLGDE